MGQRHCGMMLFLILFCWCVMASHEDLAHAEADQGLCLGDFDYGDVLSKAILFFEGQRSGKLPAGQRVKWRGDSALSDGRLENVNLVGGYYDAGDNVKFSWPMAFTVTLLSWTATEYQREISATNQLRYLQSAIKWGTDFLLRAHASPTTLYTQVGDGNSDHQCWERPEDMDTARTLYKINSSSPGTEAAAEAAAALSAASIVFKSVDSNYSTLLLRTSKSLFELADKYRGSYQGSCPFYCSYSGYQDELLWASVWLYKASGDSNYLNYVLSNQGWSRAVSEFSWDNKFAGAQVLLAEEFHGGKNSLAQFKSDAASFVCALMPGSSSVQIKTTLGGLLYTRDSSNLQYATSASMVLLIHSKMLSEGHIDGVQCGSAHFSASQIREFAKSQVDYILGKNPMNMSYMVGWGTKYPRQLHHRGASIPSIHIHPAKVGCHDGLTTYYSSTSPNPNTHEGAIVGGPDSNDQFSDLRSDYSHSEPMTYMNAAFVGAVAALVSGTQKECVGTKKTEIRSL
ncbi:endoglucanase-like [Rhodamnia argentea]|uniref:Endoglucanase n=1 Tax=Rhodamnia argentea TaxID=178133 RepID=A0A8B8P659_9MYRT|nr:endoglucanase-like [Rhodamnia argentea]